MPRAKWLAQLRAALDLSHRNISRRAAIGLGAAAAVTAAAATSAGLLVRARVAPPPYPKPATVHFDNPQATDTRMLWYYVAGSEVAPAVALAQGVVYVNSDDGLVALHASDGSRIWQAPGLPGGASDMPVIAGSAIYVGGGLGRVFALNAADGTEIWQIQIGTGFADPVVALADGGVYLLADDGTLYAYDAATGAQRWKGANLKVDALSLPGIAAGGGALYVGAQNGNLYAFNAADGSPKWSFLTGGGVTSTPTLAGGVVYFGSKDTYVYAVNASDGSLLWRYQSASDALEVNNAPVISQGVAYIGLGINMTALDAASGALLWQAPAALAAELQTTFDTIDGQATVAGDMIFAGCGAYLYAFSINSPTTFSWRFQTRAGDSNHATPLMDNGVVYLGADSHTIYALRTT